MMLCKIMQNTLRSHLSQNGLSVEQWHVLPQLWSADKPLWCGCSKAMTSPAAQCHKQCLCQILPSLCHGCERKVQSRNGHFLLSARLCEILTTRSDSESPDTHLWAVRPGVVTAEDGGTAMLHEILLSALPSSLPRKLLCAWITATTGFLFLLAPGLGMRQQVPGRLSAMCLPITGLCHREGKMQWCGGSWPSPEAAGKDCARADGAYTWFPSMYPAISLLCKGNSLTSRES